MRAVLLTNQTALALAGFALVGVGISNVIPALIWTPLQRQQPCGRGARKLGSQTP